MCANGLDNTSSRLLEEEHNVQRGSHPLLGSGEEMRLSRKKAAWWRRLEGKKSTVTLEVRESATPQATGVAPAFGTELLGPKMVAKTTAILLAPAVGVRFYVSGRD